MKTMKLNHERSIMCLLMAILLSGNAVAATQECPNNLIPTTPDDRFTDLQDGTVKDIQTGLIWQRCSIGQTWTNGTCAGNAKSLSWQQALQESEALGSQWRLPNIKELNSIIEYGCRDPKINSRIFPDLPINATYYSSTPSQKDITTFIRGYIPVVINNQVMAVNFVNGTGITVDKTLPNASESRFARAVKSN